MSHDHLKPDHRFHAHHPLSEEEIGDHVLALHASGFTIVPDQLSTEWVDALCEQAERCRVDVAEALKSGRVDPLEVGLNKGTRERVAEGKASYDTIGMTRMAHLWGDACLDLLDHDTVHAIAERAMPGFVLNDVAINTSNGPRPKESWTGGFHRDYPTHLVDDSTEHQFLWFFFLLDDFTSENGATWVVPGSHRRRSGEVWRFDIDYQPVDRYPSKIQVSAKKGDLFVVDANALHSPGRNSTSHPRRSINVRLSYPHGNNVANHWEVLPESLRRRVSPRVARILKTANPDLPTDWPVRPRELAAV